MELRLSRALRSFPRRPLQARSPPEGDVPDSRLEKLGFGRVEYDNEGGVHDRSQAEIRDQEPVGVGDKEAMIGVRLDNFEPRDAQRVIILEFTLPLARAIGRVRGKCEQPGALPSARLRDVGTKARGQTVCRRWAVRRVAAADHSRSIEDVGVMQTIGLALIAFGLATPAMADETVPEPYQGVWAAARDCKQNFQNVLATVVNRELAACRVTHAQSTGRPESHTSTISLNCGGSLRREVWRDETIEGEDYLVIVQLEQGAEAGGPSIDIYKRCPEAPLGEIPLSEIPGNPVAEAAPGEKSGTPSRVAPKHPAPHLRATRVRRRTAQ